MTGTKITALAAGTISNASTDAVNGSQLYGLAASTANALGGGSSVNSDGSVSKPTYVFNGGTYNDVGSVINNINNGGGIKYFHTNSTAGDSSATGLNSTAIGPVATAGGAYSIAMGSGASSLGDEAIVIGASATASLTGYNWDTVIGTSAGSTGMNSTVLGAKATATASNGAVALGNASNVSGNFGTAVGYGANVAGANSVALGTGANASTSNSVALGNGATTGTATNVASGVIGGATYTYAGTAPIGVVSVGSAGNERQIQNVAAGRVTATSTDAVNGSQLYAADNGATTGTATNVASGVIGGTTYTYAGTTPTGVVSVGSAGAERQIQNVAAGRVTATSTDAVNGSQLFATNTQVTANTTSISNLQGAVTTINGQITNINGQIANAVQYDSSSHTSITLGGSGSTTPVFIHNVANGSLRAIRTAWTNRYELQRGSEMEALLIAFATSCLREQQAFLSALNEFMVSSHAQKRKLIRQWRTTLVQANHVEPVSTAPRDSIGNPGNEVHPA